MLINKEKDGLTDMDIHIICWDCLAGGIDTSATSMEWLVYILINHPEVQARVQAELDEVRVGGGGEKERRRRVYCISLFCLFRFCGKCGVVSSNLITK